MNHTNIMKKSLFVNMALVVVKIISGILFSSIALIADGIHSTSDLLSDIFVLLGIQHSVKPADEDHPFGHGKFEYVLSLFLGLSIITIAYNLGKNVIEHWNDILVVPSILSLGVILLVVVAKLILARYLIQKGKETGSEIIQASGQESFTDVISSAVVFIGVIGVILGNKYEIVWMQKGDKVASIIIALFIIRIGVMIVLEAIKSIQGKSVSKDICQTYMKSIEDIDGVIKVDQLDMIAYGPYYQAIVEIVVDGQKTVKEGHDIAHDVHDKLLENEKVCHVSVHVNPGGLK